MKILVKKALRDLSRAKLRTISIILAIMLSVGIGIGMVNATKNAFESFDKRLELTNYEDIDIHFEITEINILDIESIEGVESVIGRLFIPAQAQIGSEKFKTHWISAPYYDKKPYSQINGYQFFEGNYISSGNANEAMVGNIFAKSHDINKGDQITILYSNITIVLEVSGIVASPEYIYVIGDEGWPQPSLLLPLFTSYEMSIEAISETKGSYNELLVIVEDGYDKDQVKAEIENYLVQKNVRITKSLLGTEESDYQFSRVDAKALGQMGWVFGFIILGVTAVVIYNSIARLIASQRPYIGVMGALGGKRKQIIIHYCLFGFFMGVLGSGLGVIVGIGMSILIVQEYAKLIGLIEPDLTIYWINPLVFSAIGITIATIASLLGSLKTLKIGPREALTSNYQTLVFSKKPIFERIFDSVGKKRSILNRVPLRNLSRHKVRTFVTIIALAFSLILVFACFAMALGFDQPLHKNYDEYELWDAKAYLVDKKPQTEIQSSLNVPSLNGFINEPHLDDFIPIEHGGELKFVHIQGFSENSLLRNFNVIEGNSDFSRGILAGSILAKDLDLEIGSKVTFVSGNLTTTFTIVGITGELVDDSFIMIFSQAEEIFQSENVVNAVIVDYGSNSKEEIESILREQFEIVSITYTEDIINGMETFMEGIISMFFLFIMFGILAEILFVSTTVVLNILDREMEFISLRAIGANPGKIRRMVVSESLILLVGGLIIGLPLGFYATHWAMSYIAQDLMFYKMEISAVVYVLTALIALMATIIAAFISARHITAQKLADTIRQRAIS